MSTYETVIVIGMALWILVAVGILLNLLRLELLYRRVRRPLSRAATGLAEAEKRLAPVIRNAERASEDIGYIVSALRADIGEAGGSLRRLSASTEHMLHLIEERVAEISGLIEVVQEEAEETFYSTASLLRGLRGGDSGIGRGRRRVRGERESVG